MPASPNEFAVRSAPSSRTKRVLAAEMGATSETLSCTPASFRDKNLLRVKGDAITVLDPAQLSKVLQHNLGEL